METKKITDFNNLLLRQAPRHIVKDLAPSTEHELFSSPSLVIWSGSSDNTIWDSSKVNYAFRAIHDNLHLKTGLGFTPDEEIALARVQASMYSSQLLQDLVYIEVAGQAQYYKTHGKFVQDQIEFTINQLNSMGYNF